MRTRHTPSYLILSYVYAHRPELTARKPRGELPTLRTLRMHPTTQHTVRRASCQSSDGLASPCLTSSM